MSAPEVGDRYGLRTLPTYPYPSHHQTFAVGTKAEAEELRRALPNGEHCEVVRLDPESGPVSDEQGADVGMDPEATSTPTTTRRPDEQPLPVRKASP